MAPFLRHHVNAATYLKFFMGAVVLVGILWYGHFQARFFLAGPLIELEPLETVQTERVAVIRGRAENITEITLNGKSIYTDEAGNFTDEIILPDGYTIMTIRAADRFGRTTSLEKELVYVPNS